MAEGIAALCLVKTRVATEQHQNMTLTFRAVSKLRFTTAGWSCSSDPGISRKVKLWRQNVSCSYPKGNPPNVLPDKWRYFNVCGEKSPAVDFEKDGTMSSKSLSSEDPLFCRDREQLLLVGSKMKRMFQDVSLTISSEPIIHFRAMVLCYIFIQIHRKLFWIRLLRGERPRKFRSD